MCFAQPTWTFVAVPWLKFLLEYWEREISLISVRQKFHNWGAQWNIVPRSTFTELFWYKLFFGNALGYSLLCKLQTDQLRGEIDRFQTFKFHENIDILLMNSTFILGHSKFRVRAIMIIINNSKSSFQFNKEFYLPTQNIQASGQ